MTSPESAFLAERDEQRSQAVAEFTANQPPPPRPVKRPATPRQAPAKRLITTPERHAKAVQGSSQRVAEAWPTVEAVAAALAHPTLRAAGSRDGGRGSDHPDPTATVVFSHEDLDDLREAIAAWFTQGKWIEDRVHTYLKLNPELTKAALENPTEIGNLCVEQGCDFTAVRRRRCWHHYEQLLAAEKNPDQHHHTPATPSASVPDSREQCASPRVEATCGRCGWTAPALDSEHARLLLEEHHIEQHSEVA